MKSEIQFLRKKQLILWVFEVCYAINLGTGSIFQAKYIQFFFVCVIKIYSL
jgi:hypothetical protein